jgi:hypothetical protein
VKVALGCAVALFCLLFVLVGGAIFFAFTWPGLRDYRASSAWVQVPCTITASALESHVDSDGDTMVRAAIRYSFERGGTHEGTRANFGSSGFTNLYPQARALVAAHPAGSQARCLVDPKDPEASVLERTLDPSIWITGGVSAVFAGMGGFALVGFAVPVVFGLAGAAREEQKPSRDAVPAQAVRLASDFKRTSWLPIAMIAVLWNGMLLAMALPTAFLAPQAWLAGGVWIFYLPFFLVGAGMLIAAARRLMQSLNPQPVLQLHHEPRTGERATLTWHVEGRASRLRRLELTIEGVERAEYRRGTDDMTDERVFQTLPVLAVEAPVPASGVVSFTLPRRSAPSFTAAHNKIVWRVTVAGAIPAWPDMLERFEFVVHPSRAR